MKYYKKSFMCIIIFFIMFLLFNTNVVYADSLSDNINEQLGNLDLIQLETFFNNFAKDTNNVDFFSYLNDLLAGKYSIDYNSLAQYIINTFLSDIVNMLPMFFGVIAIAVLCGIVQNLKSQYLSDSVGEIVFFACMMGVVLLLASEIFSLYRIIENLIKNIAKLSEIMSPIIITLMLAVGGDVSASVYKPTVAFLSNGIINIILYAVMPLIIAMTVLNVASNFSSAIKLSKFSEFFTSMIKWIIGMIITVFSMFLSVQGITSAHFDGISIKATKYAISNSIPIVGGFIKDGFDLVVAGSVLIKNSIGVTVIILLFFMLISPVIKLAVFSLLLKLTAALIEPISDCRISSFCIAMSKTISYLTATIFIVGLMFFILVLLMTFSANAFI